MNDTLDVLECDDFSKAVWDCTNDSINFMSAALEQFFDEGSPKANIQSNISMNGEEGWKETEDTRQNVSDYFNFW